VKTFHRIVSQFKHSLPLPAFAEKIPKLVPINKFEESSTDSEIIQTQTIVHLIEMVKKLRRQQRKFNGHQICGIFGFQDLRKSFCFSHNSIGYFGAKKS
jgi:hypothetical protein